MCSFEYFNIIKSFEASLISAIVCTHLGAMVLPASYPYYLGMLQATHLSPAIILAAKFLIAFPFSYHLVNGMRHLIWDCGNKG